MEQNETREEYPVTGNAVQTAPATSHNDNPAATQSHKLTYSFPDSGGRNYFGLK